MCRFLPTRYMYCSGQFDTLASRTSKAFILGSGNTSGEACSPGDVAAAAAAAAGWAVAAWAAAAGAFLGAAVGCVLVDAPPEIISYLCVMKQYVLMKCRY